MKRWQWVVVGIVAALVAFEMLVYAAPSPNNCGLNMLCRVRTLIVSGDTSVTGSAWYGGAINATLVDAGNVVVPTTGKVKLDGPGGSVNIQYGGAGVGQAGDSAGNGWAVTGLVDNGTSKLRGGVVNDLTGANCTNTATLCFNDPAGFEWTNGSNTTVGVATAAGLISGDTGVSSGSFSVSFHGVAAEGSNGQGGWLPTTIGRGSKFRQVTCSARVAGSGGTTGVVLSLMEDGVEVDTQEINAGADTNACDDAAGTLLSGDFNYTFAVGKAYTLQVKSSTDCAGNPNDTVCNVDITR